MKVRLHGIMIGELLLQSLELYDEVFPVSMCPFQDVARKRMTSEFFTGIFVWIHSEL